MSIYSERPELPTSAALRLTPSATPGVYDGNEEVEINHGLHRMVHATYFFDVAMAKSIITWLQDKVDTFEARLGDKE
jgi:hypothetical protein